MRREQTVCRNCGKEGLQTGLDHDSPDGQAADEMAQIAVGAILGLFGNTTGTVGHEDVVPSLTEEQAFAQIKESHEDKVSLTEGQYNATTAQLATVVDSGKSGELKEFECPTSDEICPSCDSASVKLIVVEDTFIEGLCRSQTFEKFED